MNDTPFQGRCADVDTLNQWAKGSFIDEVAIQLLEAQEGRAVARIEIEPRHLGANGYLHGGAVATLADTVCGWGCRASLPDDAKGFVTIEFRTSFIGTAISGTLIAKARALHLGKRTQVWEASIRSEGAEKPVASFGCTQMVLR